LPRYAVWVHTKSIARTTDGKGDTALMVWIIQDIEPMDYKGERASSRKALNTIRCDARQYTQENYLYAGLLASGERLNERAEIVGPFANIEPDTVVDALHHKYCKALAFWR
jgi:hypothetical protein